MSTAERLNIPCAIAGPGINAKLVKNTDLFGFQAPWLKIVYVCENTKCPKRNRDAQGEYPARQVTLGRKPDTGSDEVVDCLEQPLF